ncbi:hypothetical protein CYY_007867 [Polysphondylium violaceum]|uniref:Uncharacterized protein n=1 Tax=Polysphondylium violaceum TaxID=133409 RepID=A0A8J4PQ77_9MYCE|nr:hypothetical protein CYY_007867 [Polysphondylium violaceum]
MNLNRYNEEETVDGNFNSFLNSPSMRFVLRTTTNTNDHYPSTTSFLTDTNQFNNNTGIGKSKDNIIRNNNSSGGGSSNNSSKDDQDDFIRYLDEVFKTIQSSPSYNNYKNYNSNYNSNSQPSTQQQQQQQQKANDESLFNGKHQKQQQQQESPQLTSQQLYNQVSTIQHQPHTPPQSSHRHPNNYTDHSNQKIQHKPSQQQHQQHQQNQQQHQHQNQNQQSTTTNSKEDIKKNSLLNLNFVIQEIMHELQDLRKQLKLTSNPELIQLLSRSINSKEQQIIKLEHNKRLLLQS